jgi:hypothetical protein
MSAAPGTALPDLRSPNTEPGGRGFTIGWKRSRGRHSCSLWPRPPHTLVSHSRPKDVQRRGSAPEVM